MNLALYYEGTFGYEDFLKVAAGTAYQHSDKSITPHLIMNNYFHNNLQYVIYQYQKQGLTKEQFEKDEKAQALVRWKDYL